MPKRCDWVPENKPVYQHYHDTEWGVPVYSDIVLFEFLILEGAQAGLSWETVLNKRERYRHIFHQFNPQRVAAMTDDELETALLDPGIIRNRLKVYSARKNAKIVLAIQQECGSFSQYCWAFVDGQPIQNQWKSLKQVPASTPQSDAMSKDLKKRGMSFVGSTILYAFMQAVGMVNDHTTDCFRYKQCLLQK